MKSLALVFILLFPVLSYAEINTSGLTDEQKKAMEYEVAKLRYANSRSDPTTVEKVNQWVDLGTNLGKGLASTAKELGVAANDFVKTPVGQVTAAIIIYKFIGKDLMHYSVGGLFLIIAGTIWFFSFRRVCLIDRVVVTETVGTDGKKVKTREVRYGSRWDQTADATIAWFTAFGIAVTGVSFIIMFAH